MFFFSISFEIPQAFVMTPSTETPNDSLRGCLKILEKTNVKILALDQPAG